MNEIFWVAATVLVIGAVLVVALPLIKAGRRNIAAVTVVGVLITSVVLYSFLGTSTVESGRTVVPQGSMADTSTSGSKIGSVASMLDGLAERLEENPDDGKSWLLLAQSYEHLNRIPEALAAYERAQALGQTNATLDALLTPAENDKQAQIFGQVSIADSARDLVLPTDTVFIFARADGGPAMPLAVLRRPASELPIDFLLNDSQAMAAGAKLSDYENVVVIARISRTGVATDALKGLEAESAVITVADNEHLNLIIE